MATQNKVQTQPTAVKADEAKAPTFKNGLPNVLNLRGVEFAPSESKALTQKDLENPRVKYAIAQGILTEVK